MTHSKTHLAKLDLSNNFYSASKFDTNPAAVDSVDFSKSAKANEKNARVFRLTPGASNPTVFHNSAFEA
jgi:hypothetical protein